MNAIEANLLLTKAALLDPFIVPDADRAEEWAELLADVRLDDAIAAMRDHYRSETSRLMPVHILSRAESAAAVLPDVTADYFEDTKRQALAAAGVTEAEWAAHAHDPAWLAFHFPVRELEER